MTIETKTRRYELDWLRVMAILVVFFYHSTRFFNLYDWHVKNANTYLWVEIVTLFLNNWMMPLFFIISGASLSYVIGKRGRFSKFYFDKFLRLMVPVLVAAVTHAVLQTYFEKVTHGKFSGSFFAFVPHAFDGLNHGIGATGNFAFHGMHLWYLLFLFLFGLMCYPLFRWLNGRGHIVLEKTTVLFARPGLIYLWFSLPLFLMKLLIPQAVLNVGAGGWGFLFYLWFLISGFLIFSSSALQQTIRHQRWVSVCLGIALSTVYLFQMFSASRLPFPNDAHAWINATLSFVSAWCWLFAILGFGMRHLAFDRPLLRHANEGVLAFYILHQTVLLTMGYFVVQWNIDDLSKWMMIAVSSFITIMILYIVLIRRSELLRFLFGMKSNHALGTLFGKRAVFLSVHVLYLGLIVFAAVKPNPGSAPMPLTYDASQDIILNAASITDRSSTGVHVIEDGETSTGKAIEFVSGANQRVEANPVVFIELQFSAPAGRYFVWLRGKSDIDDGYTDSVWLQADRHIGSRSGSLRLGNWLDVHPAGVYHWAGDNDDPKTIELRYDGEHTIRIQPRQTPHRIDQIWLSRHQLRIPDTGRYIR